MEHVQQSASADCLGAVAGSSGGAGMTTQAEALDRLIAAVDAGEFPDDITARQLGMTAEYGGLPIIKTMYAAFSGSLDAAKALHDALLPGCFSGLSQNIHSGQWYAWVQDKSTWHYDAKNREPARSWLLAILRAYRGTLV